MKVKTDGRMEGTTMNYRMLPMLLPLLLGSAMDSVPQQLQQQIELEKQLRKPTEIDAEKEVQQILKIIEEETNEVNLADLASPVGFGIDEFDPEDLRIIIREGNIAIAGGRPRGTLYGVYTFLEDYFFINNNFLHILFGWSVIHDAHHRFF